jgi:galactokinase/mevalonate kinase-like predicted kinase
LPGGEFYHFGTSHELLSSTLAVQNLVNDQRRLLHRDRKPHPSIFVQNAETQIAFTPENQNVWIENAYVGENWSITHEHIITGVPENNWQVSLKPGQCLDVIPIGEEQYCIRPYGYHDRFAGEEQQRKQFPVVDAAIFKESKVFNDINEMKTIESCCLLSAEEISAKANLRRLTEQRRLFRAKNWPCLAKNYKHSVFYQIDLEDAAREFAMNQLPVPAELPESEPLLTRIHDAMFRSELARNAGGDTNAGEQKAFSLLREGLTMTALIEKQQPRLSVYSDQIVWGRSPVRIDLAGGWTDTPPYCLMEGGRVLNIAIELNGQPPLQTYVKPCKEHHIVLRSIDLGASEVVKTYEELADFNHVGSPFSIPKAALVLAGFQPGFSQEQFDTLEHQLQAFGCGIEVTLLSAIPAGSGLGTSSLLASTVLGALNDFCGLMWDKNEIGRRTLVLEQLLTTGGGWQDQYGGLLHGVKLLETGRGFEQLPSVRWLPTSIYTQPEYQQCHLLYYTGITRTAKNILSEIVRRMFLNQHDELAILRAMKAHAQEMYEVIQREDFEQMGRLVGKTWLQNQSIDNGTNPPEIQALTELVDDLCLGYKLPGAGGGGYLYMVAKDPEAAARIRHILNSNRKLLNERFVDMSLSMNGLQVSRS